MLFALISPAQLILGVVAVTVLIVIGAFAYRRFFVENAEEADILDGRMFWPIEGAGILTVLLSIVGFLRQDAEVFVLPVLVLAVTFALLVTGTWLNAGRVARAEESAEDQN